MLAKILELKSVRDEKIKILRKEAELTAPLVEDQDLLPELYEWFKEILSHRDCPPHPESMVQRKKFLLIVLLFYSPGMLAGGKMVKGLRDKLAELFHIHSSTAISSSCTDLLFFYHQYKDFRQEVEFLFEKMKEKLEERENNRKSQAC